MAVGCLGAASGGRVCQCDCFLQAFLCISSWRSTRSCLEVMWSSTLGGSLLFTHQSGLLLRPMRQEDLPLLRPTTVSSVFWPRTVSNEGAWSWEPSVEQSIKNPLKLYARASLRGSICRLQATAVVVAPEKSGCLGSALAAQAMCQLDCEHLETAEADHQNRRA